MPRSGGGRSAALVASGIFLSRIAGFIRQRVINHYLGLGLVADALGVSFRIPNLLQNLFGEGVLSASFIPVYARLLGEGREREAGRVAGAVAALLGFVVAVIVAIGVGATPLVVDVLAPGYGGEKRLLVITLVRILFPATGILVFSAWCLGVLNSHRKFFLSYIAPVVWNAAIIVAAILGRHGTPSRLAVVVAWGVAAGSLLQVLVQLPTVLALARGLRVAPSLGDPEVRTVVRNFWPALLARGVNQVSAFVDTVISTLLGDSPASALVNAQLLYTLPVSLFGMSVAAAELPEMSSVQGTEEQRRAALRSRMAEGAHRIAFFIVPTAVAFLALGQVLVAALFQTGRFSAANSRYVWAILAGSAVGLLASTLSRLASSAFYALGDTRTPLKFAAVRVALTTALGFLCAVPLPALLGLDLKWGAVGLTASAGFAAWVEFSLLRRSLAGRIGATPFENGYLAKLWISALAAGAVGWGLRLLTGRLGPITAGVAVLAPYTLVYGALTLLFRIPTAWDVLRSVGARAAVIRR
jgi:putative peptidoglycan lipid II flippase